MRAKVGGRVVIADNASRRSARIPAVDSLRGLLMVLMALDHASYFVAQNHSGEYWGGAFPAYERALPFLARLVTHPAAPGFFFLMGVSMSLFAASRAARGWTHKAIVEHFLVRGGVLVALQLSIVNAAWSLTPSGWPVDLYFGVLFGLGGAMIVSAALLRVRTRWLLGLAALLVVGVGLLAPSPDQWGQEYPAVVRLLLVPGGNRVLWVNYPVLPWLGVTVFGLVAGRWLLDDPRATSRRAIWIGAGLLVAFLGVRSIEATGGWRSSSARPWIDFLNVVKYPPGISFLALTMGLNLSALGLLGRASGRRPALVKPLAVLGRTPLLFYVLHLFLYAGLGRLFAPQGTTILAMLPAWLLGLAILYPICLLYGKAKRKASPGSALRFA